MHSFTVQVTAYLAAAIGALTIILTDAEAPPRPAQPPVLTKEQRQQQLRDRNRLFAEAERFCKAGQFAEAISRAQKMLEIERRLFGNDNEDVAGSLQLIAAIHERSGDHAAARAALAEVVTIKRKLYGPENWQVTDAQQALADLDRTARLTPVDEQRLAEANRLHAQAGVLYGQRRYPEAIQRTQRVLELTGQVLGKTHPNYATLLNDLALFYRDMGDYERAEPLYQQALSVYKAAVGPRHPYYATALNSLGGLYWHTGDYDRAAELLGQALELRRQILGQTHPDYATSLNNLGLLYRETGAYGPAESLLQRALTIISQRQGTRNTEYATTLTNLALLYDDMGDYARAAPLCRRAATAWQQAVGRTDPRYATVLNNLAGLYQDMGDYTGAEPLLRQALAVSEQTVGQMDPNYANKLRSLGLLYMKTEDYARAEPLFRQAITIYQRGRRQRQADYARALDSLAGLYRAQGHYAQAEPLFRQVLELDRRIVGEKHPSFAASLNSLGLIYEALGDYARAEPYFQQSKAIWKKTQGEKHPNYAASLNNLALLYQAGGDYARAAPLFHQALGLSQQSLRLSTGAQSERQQLAMRRSLRYHLDNALNLAFLAHQPPSRLYEAVLSWKGATFARQQRLRLERHHPELAADFARLQSLSARLTHLVLSSPAPEQQAAYQRQMIQWTDEKERLEADLMRRSQAFREEKNRLDIPVAQLQRLLPKDAALVDFLLFQAAERPGGTKGQWRWQQHLGAFIVRRETIHALDLGPAAPLEQAVARWRQQARQSADETGEGHPGVLLRAKLWQPVEKYLAGAKLVLISPDGFLSTLPFGALPGSRPGRYLLEEHRLNTLPVPQLLPELSRPATDLAARPSLLLVGDVDFGAPMPLTDARATGRRAVRGWSGLHALAALPGTGEEVAAIGDRFGQSFPHGVIDLLSKDQATKSAFRHAAPHHTWLHLATHGFFAPANLHSALAPPPDPRPWLLARRVCAAWQAASQGAWHVLPLLRPQVFGSDVEAGLASNSLGRQGAGGFHPGLLSGLAFAGANQTAEPGHEDGILTALEAAELDLDRTQLVTLSACETGLGAVAGGEGLLGLQRAFQVAGARSVVASLWKVPDRGTQALMRHFYDNLWRKHMSKLDALRAAQLWALHEGWRQPELWRGLDAGPALPKTVHGRLPPYYWAAFILSGDWR